MSYEKNKARFRFSPLPTSAPEPAQPPLEAMRELAVVLSEPRREVPVEREYREIPLVMEESHAEHHPIPPRLEEEVEAPRGLYASRNT